MPDDPHEELVRRIAGLYTSCNELVATWLRIPLVAGQTHPMTTPEARKLGAELRLFREFLAGKAPHLAGEIRRLAGEAARDDLLARIADVPGQQKLFESEAADGALSTR